MKAEIKEYCIRCGICVGLYPQLFAHNFEKDCIDVKYDEIQIGRASCRERV